MDISGIGRRIAYWRERRRMTQAEFGALLGKSRRWVQDLEAGHRQADPRLSILEGAARVLAIRLEDLLSDTASRSAADCVDDAELEAIHTTLQRHDVITGTCNDQTEPLPLPVLEQNVAYGWTAFQAGHFASLGRLVPRMIIDTNRAAALGDGDTRLAAFGLLALSLETCRSGGGEVRRRQARAPGRRSCRTCGRALRRPSHHGR